MWANDLLVGFEISWWFPNILPLESELIGMVPKNPATRPRINRNGSHSSGSEISCDTVNILNCPNTLTYFECVWLLHFHCPYLH